MSLNPYYVFLKGKFMFHTKIGKVQIINPHQEELKNPCLDDTCSIEQKLNKNKEKIECLIGDYWDSYIKMSEMKDKDVLYWVDGNGCFLANLVGLNLKSIKEYQIDFKRAEREFKNIRDKCSKEKTLESSKKLKKAEKTLNEKYECLIKKIEDAINYNQTKIASFVSSYGFLQITSAKVQSAVISENISEVGFQRAIERSLGVMNETEDMMLMSDFINIYNSFCMLVRMYEHSGKLKEQRSGKLEAEYADPLFTDTINLFLQYLTGQYFFIGKIKAIGISRFFVGLNEIYRLYIKNGGSRIGFWKNIADISDRLIPYSGMGCKEDLENYEYLKQKYIYVDFPPYDPSYDYSRLRKRFDAIGDIFKFLIENKKNLYYRKSTYYCQVRQGYMFVTSEHIRDAFSRFIYLLLQDIINDAFKNCYDTFHFEAIDRKVEFLFKPSPIEALKIELGFDMIAGITYQKCNICGKLFIPSSIRNKSGCCCHKCIDLYYKRKVRAGKKNNYVSMCQKESYLLSN